MSIHSQFEAEEDEIVQDYNNGNISLSQYNNLMSELHSEYRSMAEEAAQDAYDNEMQNW